ncbi:ABC transporter permease [Nonomuraea rubra]|uniref:Peptide/nickel transport system permease protein n=1 Tax=Nonomuraea rubra TaxID=46180 RepID=A0A7X0NTS2_9ACTN|nr:ABC transporter permease [Nonomuraea rubra]MBB6549488.1 peptide/nickel transport system permease protein [Nonomuraea rubra]
MIAFIARRLIVSFFVLLAATMVIYGLTALAGDPLEDLRELPGPDRERRMADRVERMNLDDPLPLRYLSWLGNLFRGDLGVNRDGQDVATLLGSALSATLQLVVAATVLAVVIGVIVGIVSALRQYSAFDYSVTFTAFVCFSLPLFWVAVMLKQYLAIEFNDWLRDPVIPPAVIGVVALLGGLVWGALWIGGRQARLAAFGLGAAATALTLTLLSVTRWFADPGIGVVLLAVLAGGTAVGITALISGLRYRDPLYAALSAAGIGVILSELLDPVLADPSWLEIFGLALLTVAVCVGLGYGLGGLLRRQAILASVLTGLLTAGLVFLDRMLRGFADYSDYVRGRPISTIGSSTPNFQGDFWQTNLDMAGHLLLPTMALILISLATYTRYSRSSMLEVMNLDYVRTARAKGLPERTVVTKHAFRNGMIPITTLMAFDFAGVIGGAIVTENVFGWEGMGSLFLRGLQEVDPAPVMAFFIVSGSAIVLFNMLADIIYAYLDPRIRLS